jgi:hypothetical protein
MCHGKPEKLRSSVKAASRGRPMLLKEPLLAAKELEFMSGKIEVDT